MLAAGSPHVASGGLAVGKIGHMMGHSNASQQRVTDDEKTDFIQNFFPWPSHHGDQASDRYAFACCEMTAIDARRCQFASLAKVSASSGIISVRSHQSKQRPVFILTTMDWLRDVRIRESQQTGRSSIANMRASGVC